MKFFATFFLAVITCFTVFSQSYYKPQPGDLLFQDIDCGDFCDAIEKVTVGIYGAKFSHVGIAMHKNDSVFIIEAASKGVVVTPLKDFLNRSVDESGKPKVIAGRVESNHIKIEKVIENALSFLGKPYDDVFDLNNDALYCSELVYFSFKTTGGDFIFNLNPMTFKDPETNETFKNWAKYFIDLGVEIPEGRLGLNPGGISLNKNLKLVHIYGKPDGFVWKEN